MIKTILLLVLLVGAQCFFGSITDAISGATSSAASTITDTAS